MILTWHVIEDVFDKLIQLAYAAGFYGWPYVIMLLDVWVAIYFANKFFFDRNIKKFKKSRAEKIELRDDFDEDDLPDAKKPEDIET